MVEGEKRRFWIPAKLAYEGVPGRPQGMLVFDIELIRIGFCTGIHLSMHRTSGLRRLAPLGLLVLLTATACDFGSSNPSAPTAPDQSNVPYSQTDLTVGTGAEATAGSTAAVQYGAWLYSDATPDHKGTQID